MYPANHSVVLMNPNAPCVPNNLGHPSSSLWWSGFYPVKDANNVRLPPPPPSPFPPLLPMALGLG